MMEEKDKIIDQLKTENQAITEKLGRLRKQANMSTQKSMTGLPQSVVKEKQSNTLKFKTKQRQLDESTASTTTLKSVNSANLTDKQLLHDNQMLTNELIVLNRDLSKTKQELKLKTEQSKKNEKALADQKKALDGKENALEKMRKERDEMFALVNSDKYQNFKSADEEKVLWEQKVSELEE